MPNFQIIVRLELARAHAHDLGHRFCPREIAGLEELLLSLQSVVAIAHESGRGAFSKACREVCERLRTASFKGYFSPTLLELTAEWAAIAELHIRRPQCYSFAKALVSLLNDSRWGTAMDAVAQSRLIDELTAQRSLERTQPET